MTTSQYTSRFQDESQRTLQSEKERREAISTFSHKLYQVWYYIPLWECIIYIICFQSIAATETGNIFLSPLTVQSALDSLSLGAAGETLAELNAATGSSASSRVYWNLFNRLQTKPYINAQKDIYLRDPVPDSIQRSARNNLKTTFNTIDSENIEITTRLTLQVEWDKPFTSTGIEPFGQSSIEMMSAIVNVIKKNLFIVTNGIFTIRVILPVLILVGWMPAQLSCHFPIFGFQFWFYCQINRTAIWPH